MDFSVILERLTEEFTSAQFPDMSRVDDSVLEEVILKKNHFTFLPHQSADVSDGRSCPSANGQH